MGSITEKENDSKDKSSRTFDTASIRHLSIEEQIRYQKDMFDTWMRQCQPHPDKGTKMVLSD